jgi:hypothetical protein
MKCIAAIAGMALVLLAAPVQAVTIANRVAVFSGLDKITGRITNFDVYIDETVMFGSLQITPRACYTRPPTETQRTSVFVEVDTVSLQQTLKRVFTGWMFADSPALSAIDNAVYDIWLIDCRQTSEVPPPETREDAVTSEPAEPAPAEPLEDDAPAAAAEAPEAAPEPPPEGSIIDLRPPQ